MDDHTAGPPRNTFDTTLDALHGHPVELTTVGGGHYRGALQVEADHCTVEWVTGDRKWFMSAHVNRDVIAAVTTRRRTREAETVE